MKAFEAGGFCAPHEYTKTEGDRLPISSIDINEVYMLMFALKSQNPQKQAAKWPARVHKIAPYESDLRSLGIVLLDADLKEAATTDAIFRPDGLWVSELGVQDSKVRSAYFRSYEDDMDWELLSLSNSLQVVHVSELRPQSLNMSAQNR